MQNKGELLSKPAVASKVTPQPLCYSQPLSIEPPSAALMLAVVAAVTRSWVWHLSSPARSVRGRLRRCFGNQQALGGSLVRGLPRARGGVHWARCRTHVPQRDRGLWVLSQGAQQLSGDLATVGKSAEIGAKIEARRQTIADFDKRIGQIDEAVSVATKRGRTSSAMDLATAQRNPAQRVAGP